MTVTTQPSAAARPLTAKIRYRYVFNRKKHLNCRGEALVQIEAYQYGRKAYFGTNIYICPSQWDGAAVVARPDAAALNGMLREMLVGLQQIEVSVWRCGASPTLDNLRRGWRRKVTSLRLRAFAEDVVEQSTRRASTKLNLLVTVRLLDQFRPVDVCDLDYQLLRDFETHLRRRGNCQNTILKHLHNLRTIAGEAVRRGYLSRDALPFDELRMKAERTEHTTLTLRELHRIEAVACHADVRDAFLFCCRTGLRFSDYVRLRPEHFCQRGRQTWLELRMQKTCRRVQLPLDLLGRLLGPAGSHPSIGPNGDTNLKLRRIVEEARIGKRVTFHTARHTFATLLLQKGVPITTVQALLGHSRLATTERYAEVKEQTIVSDLGKAAK